MSEGKMAVGFIGAVMVAMCMIALISIFPDEGWENHGGVRVWTDAKTGCRYTPGDQGMSPLLGPDGKPDCVRRP